MASKRKKSSIQEDTCHDVKQTKTGDEYRIFNNMTFYIHPGALSKQRKEIFTKQISKRGGKTVDSITNTSGLMVLIEDNLMERDKLENLARKCLEQNKDLTPIGLSWMSKCLEENRLFDVQDFCISASAPVTEVTVTPQSHIEKTPYVEKVKQKFVCAQSSENPTKANLNQHITDELEKLASAYKSTNDTWRAFGYQKAIAALKSYPEVIRSRDQAARIPNVGKKMADKIMEIIEDGSLEKVKEVCESEKVKTLELFNKVWGAGPSTAEKWYDQGFRTLEDLEQSASLNRHQRIGLKHFHDFDERMPREECTEILNVVKSHALAIQEGLEVIACGSYRREKPTCGDLDILICHEDELALEGVFDNLLAALHKIGFLTDDLTIQKDGRQRKYLGVCKLLKDGCKHRRLDIIVVPPDEKACALMYFTGSAHFNRSMRLFATKMGMSLSEHALVTNVLRSDRHKVNEGTVIPTPTEESVFEALGLPFRHPHERDH